jgi:hypothetical protein
MPKALRGKRVLKVLLPGELPDINDTVNPKYPGFDKISDIWKVSFKKSS